MFKKIILLAIIISISTTLILYQRGYNKRPDVSNSVLPKNVAPTPNWLGRIYKLESPGHEFENQYVETSSSSAWLKPLNPYTIMANSSLLGKKVTESEWDAFPNFKKSLLEAKLTKTQYQYLLNNGLSPRTTGAYDLTGDGIKDFYVESVGLGCGSCRLIYITIFSNNHIYSSSVNEGDIIPIQDGSGFYLADYNYAGQPATATFDTISVGKFIWNNNSFNEVEEKTVWLKPKG